MTFFRSSFSSVGESLRTVTLAIGIFIASVTGIGYIYNIIHEQRAIASEILIHDSRIQVLEQEIALLAVDRHRIAETERMTRDIDKKIDRLTEIINELRFQRR